MSDEFFAKVDSQLDKITEAKALKESVRLQNAHLSAPIIEKCAQIVQEYVPRLKERGLDPRTNSHSQAASFELKDDDGDGFGVTVYLNSVTGRLEFSDEVSDKGRRSISTFLENLDAGAWDDNVFRSHIEKAITAYMQVKVRKSGA